MACLTNHVAEGKSPQKQYILVLQFQTRLLFEIFFNSSSLQRAEYQFTEYIPLTEGLTEEEIQVPRPAAPLLVIINEVKIQCHIYLGKRDYLQLGKGG